VVPYPPGFPVLVPGQVVSKEILYFLAQLDVKEIHGYDHDLGLSVFTEAALKRITAARCAIAEVNGHGDASQVAAAQAAAITR
jgi:arginine decarboxylase